jgi:hypothetical protein
MSKHAKAVAAAFDYAAAWNAAAFVIARRTIEIQFALARGDFSGGPEASRMVVEKFAAAQEGAAAAWRETMRHALLPPANPYRAGAVAASIAKAATRPALRRARANAKRLRK